MNRMNFESLKRKHAGWRIFLVGRRYSAEPVGANCPDLITTSRLVRLDQLITTYPGQNPETLGWPCHVETGAGHKASWEP